MLVQVVEASGRVCTRVCQDGISQARLSAYRTSAATGTLAKGKREKVNIAAGEKHSNS